MKLAFSYSFSYLENENASVFSKPFSAVISILKTKYGPVAMYPKPGDASVGVKF